MKAYKLKRTIVGILLVILTLGFCVVGTGAAKDTGAGQPPMDRQQGFTGRGGQRFDGQTPPDFDGSSDAENAPDGQTPPDFGGGFGGHGGRGQFGPGGQCDGTGNGPDGQAGFGRGGQRGFGRGGFDYDGCVRQAIEALEDGETKTKLQGLLDAVQKAMEALRAADETSRESAQAAVDAAREALDAALKEAGIEVNTTPPELPEGAEGMTPPEPPEGAEGMTPPELPEGAENMTPPEMSEEQMQALFQSFQSWLSGKNT